MAGRTLLKHCRVYVDGYDLSGNSRNIGPLVSDREFADLTAAMGDSVQGGLPNHASISVGTLNGIFDNTATTGMHIVMGTAAVARDVLVAIGDRAAPVNGVPAFAAVQYQLDYKTMDDGGAMVVEIPFGPWDPSNLINYEKPWGTLLHANAAATAANSSGTGIEDNAASSSAGGWMMYHGTAGDGTATITVQHSADEVDGNYANITGLTSGELDFSSVQSGIAQAAVGATVNRYTRWQISLNTANTVTFALAFIRG